MNIYKNQSLEKQFHFTEDDLQLNREGRLSRTQMAYLRRRAYSFSAIVVAAIAILGLLSYFSAQPDPPDFAFMWALIIPVVIVVAGTIGATELAILPGVVSKLNGTVYLAYGMAAYEPIREDNRRGRRFMLGRTGAYTLLIQDQEFRISRDQWNLIRPGAIGTVYWIPTIRKIVALEIIDHDLKEIEPILHQAEYVPLPLLPDHGDDHDSIRA